jgi:hypothetical protein
MNAQVDAARCPLCGQPNRCAMEMERASGVAQGPCWCTNMDFTSELLARVPASALGTACICAACAAQQLKAPGGPPAAP